MLSFHPNKQELEKEKVHKKYSSLNKGQKYEEI